MFRAPRSLIRPDTIRRLQQLARDGVATAQAAMDPTVTVAMRRWDDAAADFVTGPAVAVVVTYADAIGAGPAIGESSETAQARGTVRAFAPWDVQIGDRFTLPGGDTAVITSPAPYEQFGTIRASWIVEQGTP